jgi:hypothetical protein
MTFVDLNANTPISSSCIICAGAPPSSRSYLFGFDSTRTKNDTIWFGRPGVYLLSAAYVVYTQAWTAAAGDMYTVSFGTPTAIFERMGADLTSGGYSSANCLWKVTITEANTSMTTVLNGTWTGAANSVQAGTRVSITVPE